MNVELPIYIDRAVDLACHEGYPGHHVYNALLEQELQAVGAQADAVEAEPLRAEAPAQGAPTRFLQAAVRAARAHPLRGVKLLGPAPAPMDQAAAEPGAVDALAQLCARLPLALAIAAVVNAVRKRAPSPIARTFTPNACVMASRIPSTTRL